MRFPRIRFRLIFLFLGAANQSNRAETIPPPLAGRLPPVAVYKCCPQHELMIDQTCESTNLSSTSQTDWVPTFYRGSSQVSSKYYIINGFPDCGVRQHWPIYHNGTDRLRLLPDGTLRHYTLRDPETPDSEISDEELFLDYKGESYCSEKKEDSKTGVISEFAFVCVPEVRSSWKDADFVLRRIVDPTCHVIAIMCFLTAAIIHFVLPQLRDMVGNILTTMSVCLAIAQAADLVRIFTEFSSPSAFLVADLFMFISLLAAFLWLNSLGFYIWKTFRSHNVFLRITDGRKYCYYSYYVWSWTLVMSVVAIFAHFFLDIPDEAPEHRGLMPKQVALGWLGIAVFFLPVACTVLLNVYFYLSTLKIMNSMASYGRIHHKLKYSFETFFKLFIVMTLSWMFLLVSWLPFNGTYYAFILVNAVVAPLILYISVLSQKRVRFLLRKVCCFETCLLPWCRPDHTTDIPEWGEEMMAMHR